MNSRAGVALATILLGTLVAQVLTCQVQRRTVRNEQRLILERELLVRELETVEALNGLVGSLVASAEALISLSSPEFVARMQSETGRGGVEDQADAVRREFNESLERWNRESPAISFSLLYYHGDSDTVDEAWRGLRNRVADFAHCAREWHRPRPEQWVSGDRCTEDYLALEEAMTGLNALLSKEVRHRSERPSRP